MNIILIIVIVFIGFVCGGIRERVLNKKKFTEEEAIKIIIKFNQEIQEVEDVRGWFKENGYGEN